MPHPYVISRRVWPFRIPLFVVSGSLIGWGTASDTILPVMLGASLGVVTGVFVGIYAALWILVDEEEPTSNGKT